MTKKNRATQPEEGGGGSNEESAGKIAQGIKQVQEGAYRKVLNGLSGEMASLTHEQEVENEPAICEAALVNSRPKMCVRPTDGLCLALLKARIDTRFVEVRGDTKLLDNFADLLVDDSGGNFANVLPPRRPTKGVCVDACHERLGLILDVLGRQEFHNVLRGENRHHSCFVKLHKSWCVGARNLHACVRRQVDESGVMPHVTEKRREVDMQVVLDREIDGCHEELQVRRVGLLDGFILYIVLNKPHASASFVAPGGDANISRYGCRFG